MNIYLADVNEPMQSRTSLTSSEEMQIDGTLKGDIKQRET